MPHRYKSGGPANLAGIHYQLLRSLFHQSRIIDLEFDSDDEPRWSRLVLEAPAGHDIELQAPDAIDAEQTKIRSTGSWPLSEIVQDVLPGLYRAFARRSPLRPIRQARFVTDAPRGRWSEVERFFLELPITDSLLDPVSLGLDDAARLSVGSPNLERILATQGLACTRRGLFLYIARVVTSKSGPDPNEERRVWELLRAFRFERIDEETLKQEVRAHLRGRVLGEERVDLVLKQLLADLLSRGRHGATIEPNDLLAQHGLAERSLRDRQSLVARAQECLNLTLASRYREGEDVRAARWQVPGTSATAALRPEIFTGEGGRGKSWALAARAQSLARQGRLVLLIEAARDFDATCQRAAARFCHAIWGIDGEISLARINERLRTADPDNSANWLELLIDGVQGFDLAEQLTSHDWAGSGVQLTFSLTTAGSRLPASLSAGREISIPDFSTAELHDYLGRRLGARALQVPYSESSILHRPLWASIFCDLASSQPATSIPSTNEFLLLSLRWEDYLRERPLAAAALADLAAQPPGGRAYPWSMQTLRQAGLDDSAINLLTERGWLRRSRNGRTAELWHDRILSWAVAEGWATHLADGVLTPEGLAERMRGLAQAHGGDARWGRRWLREALTDVLWILLEPGSGLGPSVRQIVRSLYNELPANELALLETRIVPTLFELITDQPSPKTSA